MNEYSKKTVKILIVRHSIYSSFTQNPYLENIILEYNSTLKKKNNWLIRTNCFKLNLCKGSLSSMYLIRILVYCN